MTFKTYIYSMKILHLTLKKQWFDMIASGEKLEEYREVKPYWTKRFLDERGQFKHYDIVRFRNGYAKDAPTMDIELLGIKFDFGQVKWGAEFGVKYYKLSLGQMLSFSRHLVPLPIGDVETHFTFTNPHKAIT